MRAAISKPKAVYLSIILLLILILVLQQVTGSSRPPEIAPLAEEIDLLEIEGSAGSVRVERSGGQWLVGNEQYPADGPKVMNLVDKIKRLTPLERVGSSGYLEPYGLDEGAALTVRISGEGEAVRTVLIGRASPTGRQSYLKFPDQREVLLVEGNLRRDFEIGADSLRDRNIMSIDPASIRRFAIASPGDGTGVKREFYRTTEGWMTQDGAAVDQEAVISYLRNYESLSAVEFPGALKESGESLMHVGFETDQGKVFIELLSETDNDQYLARSSESPYLFTVNRFRGEQIRTRPEELLRTDSQ